MNDKIKETKLNLSLWWVFQRLYPKTGKSIFKFRLILLVCFAVCITSTAHSETFVVNSTLDLQDATPGNFICSTATAGQCTLRAAITEANAKSGDDIIILPAGTYTETLAAITEDANAGGDFDITSNITITGAGAGSTIIQAAPSANQTVERVLHFLSGTSTVSGVTIRYGGTPGGGFGGGIIIEGLFPAYTNVTLSSVTISDNNSATFGGGIAAINGAALTMNDSLVTNNFAGGSGGGIYTSITNSTTAAPTALNNTTVSFNRAVVNSATNIHGGGVSAEGVAISLNNSSISDNTVLATTSGAVAEGGGIYCICVLNNSAINNNTATANGGSPAHGGGMALFGTTTINDSSVTNNVAKTNNLPNTLAVSSGGGIYAAAVPMTINRTYVAGNKADEGGGIRSRAIRSGLPPRLDGTYINQSAIINNTGTLLAGGILFEPATNTFVNEPVAVINNSTIARNTTNGNGGGIVSRENGSQAAAIIEVNFSTIARNVADEDNTGGSKGGGVFVFGTDPNLDASPIYLKNSVVADNSVGTGSTNPDVSGPVLSEGYNHVEELGNATFITATGDVTGSDPALGLLIVNGSNSIFIPAANSSLIDQIPSGVNGCGAAPFDVDQRGMLRPTDTNRDTTAACEKGAVEIMSPTAASVPVSGRVLTASGRGIVRARVTLTDSQGQRRTVLTNMFGYYRFQNVTVGETYIFTVGSKMFRFTTQVLNVFDEATDLNFTAEF